MSDLIDRQAAIAIIHSLEPFIETEKALKLLPSAQPDQWIPVSERLPEKTGKYLVTVKNGNVYATAYCAMDKKFNCAAVAWMDLPEPYKEEGDNE